MIKHFEQAHVLEPEGQGEWQWGPAIGAGLIAGLVLLIVPRGSPWESLTFFSPAIMGRMLPLSMQIALPLLWAIHLAISLAYGLIISCVAARLNFQRAVLAGAALGIALYVLNLAVVSLCWPGWRGNEVPVIVAHAVFGLICSAAYRGLLKRKAVVDEPG